MLDIQIADAGQWLELAVEEVGKVLGDLLMVAAFYLWALLTDLAHVVEEQCLHLIVLSFFGAFK